MIDMIINLLVAHFVGDFYLQNERMCNNKIKKNFRGWGMIVHALLIGLISYFAIMNWAAYWIILSLMLSHFVIDCIKSKVQVKYKLVVVDDKSGDVKEGENAKYNLRLFVVDQIIHICIIIGLVYYWFYIGNDWSQFEWATDLYQQHPLWTKTALAMILVIKPANTLVLFILSACKVNVLSDNNDDHGNFHSGALIGYSERAIILLFVILSQYGAIGFLLTAKSILRYNQAISESEKSEYVLAGSLVSLVIAVFLGIIVTKL